MQEFIEPVHQAPVSAELRREEDQSADRNDQSADDHARAVERIGNRNGLQASEYCVYRTDNGNSDTYNGDGRKIRDAENLVNWENVDKHLCARIKDGGQHDQNKAEQHDNGYCPADRGIVSLFEKFRQCRHTVFQKDGEEQHRCNDKSGP